MNQETPCLDCEKAAKHSYSDETTAGFFYDKCEKHRAAPEQPVSAAPQSAQDFWRDVLDTNPDHDPWPNLGEDISDAVYEDVLKFAEAYAASLRHEIAALKEENERLRGK